jgi:hypothetical protein
MGFNAMGNWGNQVEKPDINHLPIPASRGSRHYPIPHSNMVDMTMKTFDRMGFELDKWEYYLSNDNQRMLAGFQIKHPGLTWHDEWSLTGGIMTSTNSTISARLLLGQNVGVCDNGCVWAEHQLSHKHTENAANNLKYMIMDKAETIFDIAKQIEKDTNNMKSIRLVNSQVHDFVVQSCRDNTLKWQHAPLVLEQWYNTKHESFKARNQWSLFNAYTDVWRDKNRFDLSSRTSKLHNLIHDWNNDEFVGPQTNPEDYFFGDF